MCAKRGFAEGERFTLAGRYREGALEEQPRPSEVALIAKSGSCSPVAFNDIKHLARSMPADGLEAQDVVPPRCGCWVAHKAIFSSRRLVFARSRAPSLAALPVITWRLRLATVMAGLWSVVAEAAFELV